LRRVLDVYDSVPADVPCDSTANKQPLMQTIAKSVNNVTGVKLFENVTGVCFLDIVHITCI